MREGFEDRIEEVRAALEFLEGEGWRVDRLSVRDEDREPIRAYITVAFEPLREQDVL